MTNRYRYCLRCKAWHALRDGHDCQPPAKIKPLAAYPKVIASNYKVSDLEAQFAHDYKIIGRGLPDIHHEYRFHPTRQFRTDFAIPAHKICIEIEGGVFSGKSRHTTGKGYHDDCTKYNEATKLGWRVLRYTSKHLNDPHSIADDIREMIGLKRVEAA